MSTFRFAASDVKKILVTGAAGFVGAALCSEMQRRNISFVPVVRRTVQPGQVSIGDLDGAVQWGSIVAGCDTVIHLAARVHQMQEALSDPLATYRKVNVVATAELAAAAAAARVKRFIFISSAKVNGDFTRGQPFRSDDVPCPSDAYARSKWEAEQALLAQGLATGMEIVIVRPPLVYGPRVQANFLKLMRLVHSGVPLPLGSVHNARSLVALDNLVDFLLLCVTAPEAAGKTFLISDQHDLSTPDLIRLIAEAMHRPARLLPVPPFLLSAVARLAGRAAAAERLLGSLQVDASPASRLLGWCPKVSVEEGIRRTVNYYFC